MGEAKRRGTYEQRIDQSKARAASEKERKRAEAQAWWDGLTDEQKTAEQEKMQKGKNTMLKLLAMAGMAAGSAHG